jgi:hypothetical protein
MADEEKLVIKLEIDNSDAMAKQAEVGKSMDKTTAQADAAAKKIAAGTDKQAAAQVKAIGKVKDATGRYAAGAVADAKRVETAFTRIGKSQTSLLDGLGKIGLASSGFGVAKQAIEAFSGALADGNRILDGYARDLLSTKNLLKELATLKGLTSASDKFIAETAEFSKKTGLDIQQSDEFQKQYLGSLAAGQQKGNIQKDTQEDLMVQGGRVAARQTSDLATRGDLLGIISQFSKLDAGRKGTEQALGQAEAIRQALVAGRGDDAPLTQQLLKVAGSNVKAGGPVESLPEMAALVGVTSLAGGAGEAGTRAEALIRGLRGTTPEQIKFLRGIGIKEGEQLEPAFDKLAAHLDEQKGKGRDVGTYLIEKGFNEETARSVGETLPNQQVLKERFKLAREAQSGAALIAESDLLDQTDPAARTRNADAALKAAQLQRGQERQDVLPEVTLAKAELIAEKADSGLGGQLRQFAAWAGSGFKTDGLQAMAEARALEKLQAQTDTSTFGSRYLGAVPDPLGTQKAAAAGFSATTGDAAEQIRLLRILVLEQQEANRLAKGKPPTQGPLPPAKPGGLKGP